MEWSGCSGGPALWRNSCSIGLSIGHLLATYRLGAGRFVLNTLRIRENLGTDPVAERLLRNLLNYAGGELDEPPVELPPDSDTLLETIGYHP